MGSTSRRALALLAAAGIAGGLGGCFGYNPSAKRWAYVGDTLLVLGGGGAIAAGVLGKDVACMTNANGQPIPESPAGCSAGYVSPIDGAVIAGSVLVTAGLIGLILNATRPTVKTSR